MRRIRRPPPAPLWEAVLLGECREHDPVAHWAASEGGLVSWATLIAVAFFAVLASLVANVGIVVNEKIETQNAADAVAYSTAVWSARSMNAITASNHLIGELSALTILHHAIGGKVLDDGGTRKTTFQNTVLAIAYYSALLNVSVIATPSQPYEVVKKNPRGEATVLDAKVQLKWVLTSAYGMKSVGAALTKTIIFAKAGIAIEKAAVALAKEVQREYQFLNFVEDTALRLREVKRSIVKAMGLLHGYNKTIVHGSRLLALNVAADVGNRNHCVGAVGYASLSNLSLSLLPVEEEPRSGLGNEQAERRSQLLRASYPWVVYWRAPIRLALFIGAPLSSASFYYEKWTNHYALERCRHYRSNEGLRLYVIKGLNPPQTDKTAEAWNQPDQENLVDDLFGVLGAARSKTPPLIVAPPFYQQANPDGVVCLSQAMIYNANPQSRRQSRTSGNLRPGTMQLRAGWDTLAWSDPGRNAPEWRLRESQIPILDEGLFDIVDVGALMRRVRRYLRRNPLNVFRFKPDNFFKFDPGAFKDNLFGAFEDPLDGPADRPTIRLNWQAKLTPVTPHQLLNSGPLLSDPAIRKTVLQLDPVSTPYLMTH